MGCNKSKHYIAKETYHPYNNEWEGFTTQSFEESRVRKSPTAHSITNSNTNFLF